MNMFHDNMFLTNGMYLSFYDSSYGYIQYGFIPNAAWRFSNYFSTCLGVGI